MSVQSVTPQFSGLYPPSAKVVAALKNAGHAVAGRGDTVKATIGDKVIPLKNTGDAIPAGQLKQVAAALGTTPKQAGSLFNAIA